MKLQRNIVNPTKLKKFVYNMPPNRQISGRQYELLVQFAETHRGVAMGNLGKGFLGQQEANKAWEGLAVKLNSIGGGVMKTPEKWKRYWHLIKCRTKAEAADIRRKRMATGGGPNTINPLSDLEERIAAVIGKVAIEGITDVQIPVDLSDELPPTTSAAGEEANLNLSIAYEVEVELERNSEEQSNQIPDISSVGFFPPQEQHHHVPNHEPPQHGSTAQDITAEQHHHVPNHEPPQHGSTAQDTMGLATNSNRATPVRRPRQRRNRSNEVPVWALTIEERRIAAEERRLALEERNADTLTRLCNTQDAILGVLQQLVQTLHGNIQTE